MIEKQIIIERDFNNIGEMTIKMDDLKILGTTNGNVYLFDFAHYLVKYLNITNYKYERKCPYKLYKKNIQGITPDDFVKEYRMNWLLGDELEEYDTLVLAIRKHSMLLPEQFEFYICDILEVLQDRQYVKRISKDSFVPCREFQSYIKIKEVDLSKHPKTLKDRGYIVPEWYENNYNSSVAKS